MTGHDPAFDAVHPSGHVMFRSAPGGYLHSVLLGEAALRTDAETLARAVLLAAEVSHLKAVMQIREEITAAGLTPSAELAGPADVERAQERLAGHRLCPDL